MTTAPTRAVPKPARVEHHSVFSHPDFIADSPHEQVIFCRDAASGLRAIIAIHSTALGPALGGTRFYPYACEADALGDVLRLSRGMTFKAAAAGLRLGGGKAVIIGDPATDKSAELLRAYGRFVDGLAGRYITAGDVGTTADDMDVIAETTVHVAARTKERGGSGDTAPMTALGVFSALSAAAERVWDSGDLAGRVVGVEGIGKVGAQLTELLLAAGAAVVVADPNPAATEAICRRFPSVVAVDDVRAAAVDIYAPCALGGTVTPEFARQTTARIICGAANNQLSSATVEDTLRTRSVLWVPDYIANAGGLIQAFGERQGSTDEQVRNQVRALHASTQRVLDMSFEQHVTAGAAARRLAFERLSHAH
ncbi:Glu/Leu/Phe/Val family dehydrogenase [Nocardia africana]|uniref:Valine dehydrogenase n=1 Tax=Nocardia africana TaxID=134964 RepID=A0A378WWV4_9NOCA|nr:Glu/Leu/Phe/Val dehydrogenase dimerization domain-containing protein [Nocardia africana]MCC3312999.1 Glu/Leu/Phe/Val dehydrogenase [Nocardia africana]SUA45659.1 Valine dehydrogenase [Nocardia africana]